jgi:hypothetical protein
MCDVAGKDGDDAVKAEALAGFVAYDEFGLRWKTVGHGMDDLRLLICTNPKR